MLRSYKLTKFKEFNLINELRIINFNFKICYQFLAIKIKK